MGVGTMYTTKLGTRDGYNSDDDLCSYSFTFTDRQGTHVNMSFQAEPEYDLSVVFQQFRKFLIASGHDVENEIGEIYDYDESKEDEDEWVGQPEAQIKADKFSMDNLPNNGWPFGGLTTTSLPAITSVDFSSLVGHVPTMAPLTTEQIQSWKFEMPGTSGGASVKF